MAFDKKLLPEGAITLQEFMAKHDPKEIENYRVSYLLPDGKPLEYKSYLLSGVKVEGREDGYFSRITCKVPCDGTNTLAIRGSDWRATAGWGGKVSLDVAKSSTIAVLDYHEPEPKRGSVGKSPQEWLEMPGFNAEWFEGARFEGCEYSLTRDPQSEGRPNTRFDWNSEKQGSADSWERDVSDPWSSRTPLHLTVENEAKALTNNKPWRIGKPAEEWLAIEGFNPLWFRGAQFEGHEGCLTRDWRSSPSAPGGWDDSYNTGDSDIWASRIYDPWRQDSLLYLTPENEAKALALLGDHKPERIGRTADEWLEIDGFDPLWLEGAQFEGREGCLVRDPALHSPRISAAWDSSRAVGDTDTWRDDIHAPWFSGARLYLTPENEAKALALPGASSEEWCERREEGLGTSEIEGDDQHELLVQKTVAGWMNEEHFSPWMLEGARFPTSTGWEAELVLHSSNQYLGGPTAWSARRVSTGEWADWREVEALFSPHLTDEASNAVCIRKTNYHALLRAQGKMPWVP